MIREAIDLRFSDVDTIRVDAGHRLLAMCEAGTDEPVETARSLKEAWDADLAATQDRLL